MEENNLNSVNSENSPEKKENSHTEAPNWAVPLSIVIAGALIAGAVFWTRGGGDVAEKNNGETTGGGEEISLEVTEKDHIRGPVDAPVKVIEYSDFECPFCKMFHETMKRVVDEYDGQVAWIYRHFPIEQIHPKAKTEAIASECVAELGGNEAFWQFADEFFAVSPSNNQTDLAVLPQIALKLGINKADFNQCLESGKYDDLITKQFNEALKTGGTGTPWSLVLTRDGRILSINGAQDYAVVKQILDAALKEE